MSVSRCDYSITSMYPRDKSDPPVVYPLGVGDRPCVCPVPMFEDGFALGVFLESYFPLSILQSQSP